MKQYFTIPTDIVVGIFFLFHLLTFGQGERAEFIVPLILVIYQLIRLLTLRESTEMAFLLIFAITYPGMWLIAQYLQVRIHYLDWNVSSYHVIAAFAAQGLFMSCLFLGLGRSIPRTIAQYQKHDNPVIYWICIWVIVAMMVIGIIETRSSIFLFQAYNFAESESTVLFEYVLIPIIIAYAYSGEDRRKRLWLLGVSSLAVLAPLLVGRRLPALMVVVAMLLLYWRPRGLLKVVLLSCLGFIALSVLALARVGESAGTWLEAILNIDQLGQMRNNQGGGTYVAGVYMRLIEEGIFDADFAFRSFISVIQSIFLPSSVVDPAAYVNLVAANYIPIPGNGGFPGAHFYIWGGVLGVVLAGWLLGRTLALSSSHLVAAVYTSFLFFTFPRWMSYNVNILFKTGLLLLIAWAIFTLVNRAVSRGRQSAQERERYSVRQSV